MDIPTVLLSYAYHIYRPYCLAPWLYNNVSIFCHYGFWFPYGPIVVLSHIDTAMPLCFHGYVCFPWALLSHCLWPNRKSTTGLSHCLVISPCLLLIADSCVCLHVCLHVQMFPYSISHIPLHGLNKFKSMYPRFISPYKCLYICLRPMSSMSQFVW